MAWRRKHGRHDSFEEAGSGGLKGNDETKSAEEESEFTFLSSDEQVENDVTEEVILFKPTVYTATMSVGFDSSGKSGTMKN